MHNFAKHYNPGFLEYRKSVTEGGDFAAVEWSGRGATFTDALGRTYLDCLGGYGLLSLGWAHEKVVAAVKAQLDRSPMPTQELLDRPRGMLANLLPEITPGDLQYAFLVSSGTEAVEGAMKFAKAATGKSASSPRRPRLPRQDRRQPQPDGQGEVPPAGTAHPARCLPRALRRRRLLSERRSVSPTKSATTSPASSWSPFRARPAPSSRRTTSSRVCASSAIEYGVLLIADEVQTGLGRTGALWASTTGTSCPTS